MKAIILGVLLTFSPLIASDINIKITNIFKKGGNVKIGLYNKAESFPKLNRFYRQVIVEVSSKTIKYTFANIPDGIYAIAVFHDANMNGKIDTNLLGIPQEGYGFSNNVRPLLRSANFKEAKFELKTSKNLSIKMGY